MKKVKMLMSVSAFAMMFAACSNEFDVQNQPSSNLANRPSAGKVIITPQVVGDADTRAEWVSGGWEWTANDRFGAMLMDDWDQTNEGNTTIADYTFTDYIHTNYPFSTTDGKTWSTPEDAALCEGNYFFVYPYDKTYKMRGHVGFGVNNHQTQEVGDPTSVVRDNQKYLGYAFIEATQNDVNNVDVQFHPLFANPKFKLQNVSGMPLRLIKLVIRTHQYGKADEPMLMADSVVLAPLSKDFAEAAAEYPSMSLGASGEQTEYLFSHATLVQNGFYAQEPVQGSNIETTEEDGVYEYTVDFDKDYIVPAGEFFRVSAIMPAGEYGSFDVFAFIEEQNSEKTTGVVKFADTDKSHWSGLDTQQGAQITLLAPGKLQVFSASFDAEAIKNLGMKDFTVANSEDLAWIIDLKAKHGGNDLVTIKTLGDEVEMTKEVYDLISACNRKNIKWQIDGVIVIPADAAADAIDQLTTGTTANTVIINNGKQVLSKDLYNCDVINNGTIEEAEGEKIYIDGSVGVQAGKVTVTAVENTLVVLEGAEADVDYVGGLVRNFGKLTAKNIEGDLYNAGDAVVEKVEGNVANKGELAIENIEGDLDNQNHVIAMGGTLNNVTNSGVIDINGETVIPTLTNSKGGVINVNAKSQISGNNFGAINVNKALTPVDKKNLYNKADLANNIIGVINVKDADLSQLDGNRTGYIINDGEIYVIGASHVTVAKGYGIIDVTEADVEGSYQAKISDSYDAEENPQSFRYRGEATNALLKNLISSQNYGKDSSKAPVILVFDENKVYTQTAVNDTKVEKILVKAGATLSLEGTWYYWSDATSTDKLAQTYNALEVEKGALLQVLNGKTLKYKTSTGAIAYIDGTMRVENSAKVLGTVTVKGTGKVENASGDFDWTRGSSDLDWWK